MALPAPLVLLAAARRAEEGSAPSQARLWQPSGAVPQQEALLSVVQDDRDLGEN